MCYTRKLSLQSSNPEALANVKEFVQFVRVPHSLKFVAEPPLKEPASLQEGTAALTLCVAPHMSMKEDQGRNPLLVKVHSWLCPHERPPYEDVAGEAPELKLKKLDVLELRDDVLCRKFFLLHGQIVIPDGCAISLVSLHVHEQGHFGISTTQATLAELEKRHEQMRVSVSFLQSTKGSPDSRQASTKEVPCL